jgi:hypothetical protein
MPSAPAGPLHHRLRPAHNASLKGGGVHTISYPQPDIWINFQAQYDLWQVRQHGRPKVKRLAA